MESEAPASSDTDLVFMTCLMQLAMGARKMLRERKYQFPEVSNDLLKTFYPILSSFILEVQLREPNDTDGERSEDCSRPEGLSPSPADHQVLHTIDGCKGCKYSPRQRLPRSS